MRRATAKSHLRILFARRDPTAPPLYIPSPLAFVRVRRPNGWAGVQVGLHSDMMMNAAMSAVARETAWFVAAPYTAYITRIARKLGVYEISRLRHRPRAVLFAENAKTLDLFALHFARFSSRKSASASRRGTATLLSWHLPSARQKFACVSPVAQQRRRRRR